MTPDAPKARLETVIEEHRLSQDNEDEGEARGAKKTVDTGSGS